jgi:hypothetical protein
MNVKFDDVFEFVSSAQDSLLYYMYVLAATDDNAISF